MNIKKKDSKPKLMEAPMCRLCETRHWNNQPHAFETKTSKKKRSKKA